MAAELTESSFHVQVTPPSVADAAAASIPVVFFDGDRESEIEAVVVDGNLRFNQFQSIICRKIGMLPSQISFSLVRRKMSRSSSEIRRKMPIDEGSDFSAIAREKDCFVLVMARRSRRGRPRRNQVDGRSVEGKTIRSPEKMILRRPSPELFARMQAADVNNYGILGFGQWDPYESTVELQMRREKYLTAIADSRPFYAHVKKISDVSLQAAAICKVCSGEDGNPPPPFHWCPNDAVTYGFRSNVGPVQRPSKGQVHVSPL